MGYEADIRDELTERQDIILTQYLRGFTASEIGKEIKVSRTTVYTELHKIRKVAKKEIKGYKKSKEYLKAQAVPKERRLY